MTMQKRLHVSRNIQQDDINNIIVGKTFYHSFRFDNDTYITGWWDVASTADHIGFPPLHGKTILDIGPASGWFSFYFEHCGARVTALEIGNPDEFDNYGFNRYLRNVLQPSDSKVNRRVFNNDAFDVVRKLLESEVEYMNGSIYDIGESVLIGRQFDIVFLGSLLIHLRDPIGALMRAQSVCKDVLIATTPILHENKSDQPLIRFSRPFPGSIDWWLPNLPCYEHWFLAAGFSEVDAEHKYRQEADSPRPNPHGELTRTPILLQIAKARI